MSQPILFDIEEGIATLRVNRPQARNALNWTAQEKFAQHIDELAGNRDVRALIITGTGKAFVSGGDLKELAQAPDEEAGERLNRVMSGALAQLAELPLPVIAAVNGHAVGGGCEILTACDLRIAHSNVRLKFAQVQMGLSTGWGGGARLVRLVGQSRAMELLLTGRAITAQEAEQIGLLQRLVEPDEDVWQSARQWAKDIVRLPREAVAAMKRLIYALPQLSPEEQAVYERELFKQLWGNSDHREAMAAFLEKRHPLFDQG